MKCRLVILLRYAPFWVDSFPVRPLSLVETPNEKRSSRSWHRRSTFLKATTPKSSWTKSEILATTRRSWAFAFCRLQFTDIVGVNKNVEVPTQQFEKALDGQIAFDGSSIDGFVRIEESDMILIPDLNTFRVLPFAERHAERPRDPDLVARLICDILSSRTALASRGVRGSPSSASPTKRAEMGYHHDGRSRGGVLPLRAHRRTGDADHGVDPTAAAISTWRPSTEVRWRDATSSMRSKAMGFEVEAAHHEVAPAQHEIDFRYEDAVTTADNVATFRFVVRHIAMQHGLHATFMPKPRVRAQRLGHALPSVALRRGPERVLRCRTPSTSSPRRRPPLYRRHPETRPRLLCDHQSRW